MKRLLSKRVGLRLLVPPKRNVAFAGKFYFAFDENFELILNDVGASTYRCRNTLRAPRATREPPLAVFFRGLTLVTVPAGVSVYFLRSLYRFYNNKLCEKSQNKK